MLCTVNIYPHILLSLHFTCSKMSKIFFFFFYLAFAEFSVTRSTPFSFFPNFTYFNFYRCKTILSHTKNIATDTDLLKFKRISGREKHWFALLLATQSPLELRENDFFMLHCHLFWNLAQSQINRLNLFCKNSRTQTT